VVDAVAEEFDVGLGDGCAAVGIGDPPLEFAADGALDEDGVDDPDEGVELVAVVDFAGDPPCAGLVDGDIELGAGVAVEVARGEVGFPGGGGFADVFRFFFLISGWRSCEG
jgi:hypothetical protein